MFNVRDRANITFLHPFRAVLLAGTIPLFLGVFLSDWAYFASYELQWKNFASWLLVAGLVFCGLALLWALVELVRTVHRYARLIISFLALAIAWVLGVINALVHAMDAWASMPTALVLSSVVALLIIVAVTLGFSARQNGEVT